MLGITQKIISSHLASGEMITGREIGITIDQTLTQDATGTMANLQFEAMGVPKVRTKLSVGYVDHNMLQTGFENADDHRFLQSFAAKYGIHFSRPGNGICHQVHLERFAVPGQTLLGSDSHTPTCGGMGMLAIGAGGLDVAVAMAGGLFYFAMPKVVQVFLQGRRQPWVAAKDVIFELLRRLTVRGGVGKLFEYGGPGVATLTVPERATICNMGAELGAVTSLFPSNEQTREYLRSQKREHLWLPLAADSDAEYDEVIQVNLDQLEPMVAKPSSPDNVVPISEVVGTKVVQVCIGSCTNSSYHDLMAAAAILRGKTVHPAVSLAITPGSKQVFTMIAENGALADFIQAGARILESACGPCIGMGQAPPSGGVSLRSFNRNFEGRSGTPSDLVYLASPELCAAAALTGEITDPRALGDPIQVTLPGEFTIDDRLILLPSDQPETVEVIRGPNIKPLPMAEPLADTLQLKVLLKVGDNVTTDHILPAGSRILPLRSNIPAISEYVYKRVDPDFVQRCKAWGGGFIVGGSNYGQGSSREHAALAPMYLGVKAVFAKSFARIHWTNLINFGILPLVFDNPEDYDRLEQGDELEISDLRGVVARGDKVSVRNLTKAASFVVRHDLTERQRQIVRAGGLLNYMKAHLQQEP